MPLVTASTPRSRYQPQGRKHARYEMRTRYAGKPGYGDPTQVRNHVLELNGYGLPRASIARDAGLTDSAVEQIARGEWRTIRVRPATALMAVTWRPNSRQEIVLAVGAIRRAQALSAIGWSYRAVEEQLPVSALYVPQMIRRQNRTMPFPLWREFVQCYEALSGTPGPSTRARNAARAAGLPAPLDWEGHDIDDPRVVVQAQPWEPKTRIEEIREEAAARAERVLELTAMGLSAKEVAERLGVTSRTVVRDRVAAA